VGKKEYCKERQLESNPKTRNKRKRTAAIICATQAVFFFFSSSSGINKKKDEKINITTYLQYPRYPTDKSHRRW
jgi:hypothetical protein